MAAAHRNVALESGEARSRDDEAIEVLCIEISVVLGKDDSFSKLTFKNITMMDVVYRSPPFCKLLFRAVDNNVV